MIAMATMVVIMVFVFMIDLLSVFLELEVSKH